ncbi:hypothetical protein [Nostoc sp.]|uniref:hypothetical protein n=1 Tax=Nostoc sp. TaxID=1180 RepID=UPI002FFB560A
MILLPMPQVARIKFGNTSQCQYGGRNVNASPHNVNASLDNANAAAAMLMRPFTMSMRRLQC